jgi:transcriptional regulator with XRE-family HTH domain
MKINLIGQNIKKYRRQLGLSQNDLAKITNLSKRAIVYYEKEANNEIFNKLDIIAKALKINITDLFIDNNNTLNKNIEELDTRIIKKIIQIKKLPLKDQNAIWEYIDFILEKNKQKQLQQVVS